MLHAHSQHMHMYTRLKARERKMHDSPISFPTTGKYPTVALYNPRQGSPRVDGDGKKNNTRNVDTRNTLVAGWLEPRWWNQPRMETARGFEGEGGFETVGRYSFAVSAVVIYLKPLAVNISSSFIQRLGSFSAAGVYALLRSFLPSSRLKKTERPCSMCSRFPRNRGGSSHRGRAGSFLSALPVSFLFYIVTLLGT